MATRRMPAAARAYVDDLDKACLAKQCHQTRAIRVSYKLPLHPGPRLPGSVFEHIKLGIDAFFNPALVNRAQVLPRLWNLCLVTCFSNPVLEQPAMPLKFRSVFRVGGESLPAGQPKAITRPQPCGTSRHACAHADRGCACADAGDLESPPEVRRLQCIQ